MGSQEKREAEDGAANNKLMDGEKGEKGPKQNGTDKGNLSAKELEELYKNHPLTEDTSCGIGFLRGQWLQRFSNEKYYVCMYGVVGSIFGACFSYFNGTISTIEKRFKIPSKVSGMIIVGNDFSALLVGVFLSYYAGKKHRPRWIALGIYTVVLYCLLTLLPHLMYGVGEESLALTVEHAGLAATNTSQHFVDPDLRNLMCFPGDSSGSRCKGDEGGGLNVPAVILFLGNLISGIGGGLYHTIGMSYMDDNIEKHKIPFLISLSHFLRLLGPAMGYSLASLSLEMYIAPTLTPTIKPNDPRWIGAWWMGWIILSIVLFLFGSLIGLFPKTLPDAAVRKMIAREKAKRTGEEIHEDEKPSVSDMLAGFWRLLKNKAYMAIQISHIFYLFGYMPYWVFMAKYIEVQYRISASISSLITGTVGLVFSALGILVSGIVITKFRPKARTLAVWNILVVFISAFGIASYAFIGCTNNDTYGTVDKQGLLQLDLTCNANCSCDHVRYTPVCSQYGDRSYISPCHAGCSGEKTTVNGTVVYTDCSCIAPNSSYTEEGLGLDGGYGLERDGGYVLDGACPSDCMKKFLTFVTIVCILKFTGATSRSSNFLVSIRCVEERDKTVSMGLGMALLSIFTFLPSPIFFGYILDKTCMVWGKSCTRRGNCWLYNGEAMRTALNFTAAGFIAVGAIFDISVWYFVKDVKIFDEEVELKEMAEGEENVEEQLITEKGMEG